MSSPLNILVHKFTILTDVIISYNNSKDRLTSTMWKLSSMGSAPLNTALAVCAFASGSLFSAYFEDPMGRLSYISVAYLGTYTG